MPTGPTSTAQVLFNTALKGAALKELYDGLSAVVEISADFQDQMAKVTAVSGATAEQMVVLTARARELGAETVFTATQAGAGMEELARLGLDVGEIYETVQNSLNLAASSALGLDRAAQVVAGSLRGFKIAAEESQRIVDILATTAANSGTTVDSLGESLSKSASIARESGVTFEEWNAIIGNFGDNLIQGSEAGTAFRQLIVGISTEAPKGAAALKQLNLTYRDLDVSQKGIIPVLELLRDRLNAVKDTQTRVGIAADIWGRKSFNAALVALGGVDKIKELIAAYEDSNDTAERMAETMNDTLGGSFRLLKSAAQEVALSLSDEFNPELRGLLDGLRETATAATETGTGIEAAGKLIGTVITGLSAGAKAIELVANLVTAGIAKIVKVSGEGIASILEINAAIARAAGFEGFAEDLQRQADDIQVAADDFFNRFEGNIDRVVELGESIGEDWEAVRKAWGRGVDQVARVDLGPVTDQIRNTLQTLSGVVGAGGRDIAREVQTLTEALKLEDLFKDVDLSELTKAQKEQLAEQIGQLIELFKKSGVEVSEGIIEFRNSLTGISTSIDETAQDVQTAGSGLEQALGQVTTIITRGGDTIEAKASDVKNALTDIVGFDEEEILKKAAALEGALQQIGNVNIELNPEQRAKLKQQIEEVVANFVKIKENVPPAIKAAADAFGIFTPVFTDVESSVDRLTGKAGELAGAYESAGESVSGSGEKIAGAFSDAADSTQENVERTVIVVKTLDAETGKMVTSIVQKNKDVARSAEDLGEKYSEAGEGLGEFVSKQSQVEQGTEKGAENTNKQTMALENAAAAADTATTSFGNLTAAGAGMTFDTSSLEAAGDIVSNLVERISEIGNITIAPKSDLSGLQEMSSLLDEILGKLDQVAQAA